jgi:molybdopterin molybdotransferase
MPEFLHLLPPEQALSIWLEALPWPSSIGAETCATVDALGRYLAEDVVANDPLPPFSRSTVDGYAVRAADTYGATPGLPAYLEVVGEVRMGEGTSLHLKTGQAALIHTGGMIPEHADAVVMLEDTQQARSRQIEVLKAAASGENILQRGEDVQAGAQVVQAGTRIRAQEIGGLMALGLAEVSVKQKPRVAIISTGDELVAPGQPVGPGQVRDVNSYALGALVDRMGGRISRRRLLGDDRRALEEELREAHAADDIIVVTAGSSVSERDLTANAIQELGEPGVLVHGVHIKPGKPTILAAAGIKPVLGLPGNPVSAFVVAGYFLPPLMRRMLGVTTQGRTPSIPARLAVNIASETGREDFVPVRIRQEADEWVAEPVYGRSNLIFTLVRADGVIRIPPSATGLEKDARVTVMLLQ